MKKTILCLLVMVFVLLAVSGVPAYAYWHGGWRGGIYIGPGWWGPGWWGWGYPYPYYQSPPVVIQQQPPVYYEDQAPQQGQQYYWYYCRESKTYYPYVKECPGGWQKVIPTPAPPK